MKLTKNEVLKIATANWSADRTIVEITYDEKFPFLIDDWLEMEAEIKELNLRVQLLESQPAGITVKSCNEYHERITWSVKDFDKCPLCHEVAKYLKATAGEK